MMSSIPAAVPREAAGRRLRMSPVPRRSIVVSAVALAVAVATLAPTASPLPAGEAGGGKAEPKASGARPPAWVAAMREVHARFKGEKGTFAHFGDSITVTMAFWTPLLYARKNAPPEMERAFALVKGRLREKCWREWKGPEFGSEGGMTIRWAAENIDRWLRKLDPECALIMFGTNDLGPLELPEYEAKTREVVGKCLEHGTVPILSTIPPRHGMAEKAASFAEAARKIAREMRIPLVDYHREILRRRPDDWDGAAEKFRDFKDYDVPTLISRDGVHPSYPKKFADDFSEEGLRSSGYTLRSYLVLLGYAEVVREVLEGPAGEGGKPREEGRAR